MLLRTVGQYGWEGADAEALKSPQRKPALTEGREANYVDTKDYCSIREGDAKSNGNPLIVFRASII